MLFLEDFAMKKKSFLKILGLVLTLAMCIGVFVACVGSDGQDGRDGTDGTNGQNG
jgi:hypothetical protein